MEGIFFLLYYFYSPKIISGKTEIQMIDFIVAL